jgi:CYTH domain-containing protein
MFDIFFVGKKNKTYEYLKNKFLVVKYAEDFHTAQQQSLTDFFWVVYDDLKIVDDFLFDYVPDNWSLTYNHVFLNNTSYDGICLIPKNNQISQEEINLRTYKNQKCVEILASIPVLYDTFTVDTYEEYVYAVENSNTELFWAISKNLTATLPELYFTHDNEYDRKQNHAFIHRVNETDYYNGVFLLTKARMLTRNEIEKRFIIGRKEWDIVASKPVQYDQFTIDTYEQYQTALENSKTEMFWGLSNNVFIDPDFKFDLYFTHDNEYDRNTNHAFIHRVDDKDYYNGIFLFSKHRPVSKKEIEHRFIVDVKEWPLVASGPVKYNRFYVDSYADYKHALENSITEMFWVDSRNIKSTVPDIYFNHDNDYDRKQNHAFIHRVQDKNLYNGLFLCSKHRPLTEREVEYRHIVNRKEWDIVASVPAEYERFTIETYEDYLQAMSTSKTELFWALTSNVDYSEFDFDLYFTHDNEYDRKTSHAFLHCEDKFNGIFLLSKHAPLSKKEIEHRHIVNRKEWRDRKTKPVKYEIFDIASYEEYLAASKKSKTELFWMVSANISYNIPELYFTHDNEYDRKTNHAFIHRVNNKDYYNGAFLISKHKKLTKKEVDHRFLVNAKQWDIVVSGPKQYDKFHIENYEEYLRALKTAKTEMFWATDPNIDTSKFAFDTYFTHDNEYDRKQNHAFLHKDGDTTKYNGVFLLSKYTPITAKEIEHRHVVNHKPWSVVASQYKIYDVVFISYQEPNADENYEMLLQRVPNAKRVHGVKGIHQAHIAAAEKCETEMFWVVDGDAQLVDDFSFEYRVERWDRDMVHVWRSQNPINDMVYGYGGIKLLPRKLTLNMDVSKPDMTTSITNKFKAVPDVSNITAFNTDPFNTWKSAFRECVKLSSKIIDRQKDDETTERLNTWCNKGSDRLHGKYAIDGARMGAEYGYKNKANIAALKMINDFDWLKEQYNARNF